MADEASVDQFVDALEEATYDYLTTAQSGSQSPVDRAIEESNRRLQQRGDEQGYSVESVADSVEIIQSDRESGVIRWGWTHPAAEFFEFGTSEHTIDGEPVLSFVWEDPPMWVREEFDRARDDRGRFTSGWRVFFSSVEVDGIEELRFVRAGLEYLVQDIGDQRGI